MGGQDSQVAEQDDQDDQDRDANKSTGTATIVGRRQHLARCWEKLESRVGLATTQGHLPIRQRITTGISSALLSIRSGSFHLGWHETHVDAASQHLQWAATAGPPSFQPRPPVRGVQGPAGTFQPRS
jgi:hypothetical protein